ncbi:uncharacterized protein LOC133157277 [Syngnathus typhle]|uniref:uncharacterized protein LOC133157277 n=1 Tax=Syngnathus typhle TaxID=161592 RepID=UPI002A6AB006|nr:uncharacterized protein LOC133157277 [Syngnathus typhle]XP_061139666.1 uncharacterized protein LOC133157277 [Syngnathus typhle]
MSAPWRTRWTALHFSRSAALCFVETWLSKRTSYHAVELAGFRLTRPDRSAELSGKSKGGGLCFYINERWCTDVTVLKEFCSPLLETLFINCRPFYSPREFSSIVMAAVYIPPHARASEATQMLADQVTDMEKLLPNSLIIVLGDLNRANLAHKLPRYRQHVTCPTRGAQTPDHCSAMTKDAYHSAARAALGLSDHCLVHLIPAYRQKLKTSKPVRPRPLSRSARRKCARCSGDKRPGRHRAQTACHLPAWKSALSSWRPPFHGSSTVLWSCVRCPRASRALPSFQWPRSPPSQFAYRANTSVDDAVNMGLH